MPSETTKPDRADLHPWYGECDTLADGGECAECAKIDACEISPWKLMWEETANAKI